LPAASAAVSEATREVGRQSLDSGRCGLWLQTSLDPGAPATVSSGTFVVMRREGTQARIDAAVAFEVDEGNWALSRRELWGNVIVAFVPGPAVGTGAQEASTQECLWRIADDWIDNGFCYAPSSSVTPLRNRGWSVQRTTVPQISLANVLLRTSVTWRWLPYGASCRRRGAVLPAAWRTERSITYNQQQLVPLPDQAAPDRVGVGAAELELPAEARAQVKAWQLPAVPTTPGAGDDEDVTCPD